MIAIAAGRMLIPTVLGSVTGERCRLAVEGEGKSVHPVTSLTICRERAGSQSTWTLRSLTWDGATPVAFVLDSVKMIFLTVGKWSNGKQVVHSVGALSVNLQVSSVGNDVGFDRRECSAVCQMK